MPRWRIADDLFAPHREIDMVYTGPDPWKMVNQANSLIRQYFEISGTRWTQKDIRWDVTDVVRTFFTEIDFRREEDGFTNLLINIRYQGKQHAETKQGTVRMMMYAQLQTDFEYSNPFVKLVLLVYLNYFYKARRIAMLKRNEERMNMTLNELRSAFSLPEKVSR
ncbi:MAG: hypothetical protein HY051_01750 [Candidatus Aenigmarchaeota archaeon]|nr:hypothetical protein [Candidatus Aenigmarchaeota archaeon]